MERNVETINSFDKLRDLKHVLLRGVDQSGKTTICRKLFLHLLSRSQPTILIDLEEAGSKKTSGQLFSEEVHRAAKG